MKTIPFYEIPNHIEELEFDGDRTDLRLQHQDHIQWAEPNEKDKTVDKYFSEMYSKIVLEAEKEISEYQSNTPY